MLLFKLYKKAIYYEVLTSIVSPSHIISFNPLDLNLWGLHLQEDRNILDRN
jgi:hypothetical protein